MRRTFPVLLGLVLAPLAACGDNSGGLNDPSLWVVEYVDRVCGKAHECRSEYPISSPTSFESQFGLSASECRDYFVSPASVRTAVSRGEALYDFERGNECLAELRVQYDGQTCAEYWADSPDPEVCAEVFTGLITEGEPCTTDYACISQRCVFDHDTATEGVCAAE